MSEKKKKLNDDFSDQQAVKGKASNQYDHEFANEPLTAAEKLNNKKTKKRQ
ncbi:MAG: small acid-soluble spore protein O [Bacillus sp. (in: firmicutes)]